LAADNGLFNAGVRVLTGLIQGARILFSTEDPYTPVFGPLGDLPELDLEDTEPVGTALNLQPPTSFDEPVEILIPCPGSDDVSELSIYMYDGTQWVEAVSPEGDVMPAAQDAIVAGSRIQENETDPPTVGIRTRHFTGFIAAKAQPVVGDDDDDDDDVTGDDDDDDDDDATTSTTTTTTVPAGGGGPCFIESAGTLSPAGFLNVILLGVLFFCREICRNKKT
jgi:hypothetical protein